MSDVVSQGREPRVWIIGAGSGVGRACAAASARAGAELVLVDADQAKLRAAQTEFGGTARYCDVASEASVAILAREMLAELEPFDILVNAAGDGYVRTLGMTQMSRALFPTMKDPAKRQVVVNFAPSERGSADEPFPHAASAQAYARLSESLALRVSGWSVSVLTVLPAGIGPADEDIENKWGSIIHWEGDDPSLSAPDAIASAFGLLACRPKESSQPHDDWRSHTARGERTSAGQA